MQVYTTNHAFHEIQKGLADLLSRSGALAALVVDESGAMIAKRGRLPEGDPAEMGTLLACNFLVTQEMADVLGHEELNSLAQEGEKSSFFIRRASARTLLVILYQDQAALGRVRLFADNAALALGPVLRLLEIGRLPPGTLPEGFPAATQEALASLLNP